MDLVEIAKASESDTRGSTAAMAAGGAGAALAGARMLRPAKALPELSRRGKRVHRKLLRSKKDTVKLRPKEWAAISGGRGKRFQNDAYTANLAQAMRSGLVGRGGTKVKVYRNNVDAVEGAHRAHSAAMLGRRIPVRIESKNMRVDTPKLPAVLAATKRARVLEQRQRISDTTSMSRRELRRRASQYDMKSARANEYKSRLEDVLRFGKSLPHEQLGDVPRVR